jgi:hypothetical protein
VPALPVLVLLLLLLLLLAESPVGGADCCGSNERQKPR